MVRVKICGITNLEDALYAVEEGADAVGFVFFEKSRRFISPYKAKKISQALPPFVYRVGVFVNEKIERIIEICKEVKLNAVQLHGNEDIKFCNELNDEITVIKSIGIEDERDVIKALRYKDFTVLFDTKTIHYGGSGKTFDWYSLLPYTSEFNYFIVSGGLKPENVKEVIKLLSPFAVDVSSGVEERPGRKDKLKVKEFIKRAKGL